MRVRQRGLEVCVAVVWWVFRCETVDSLERTDSTAGSKKSCEPWTVIYWATDYPPEHEANVLSMPVSLRSAAKYARWAPRVVFATGASNVTEAPWAEEARVLPRTGGRLDCAGVHIAYATVPDDRLVRLIRLVAGGGGRRRRASSSKPVTHPHRLDLVEHVKADNLRFLSLIHI